MADKEYQRKRYRGQNNEDGHDGDTVDIRRKSDQNRIQYPLQIDGVNDDFGRFTNCVHVDSTFFRFGRRRTY